MSLRAAAHVIAALEICYSARNQADLEALLALAWQRAPEWLRIRAPPRPVRSCAIVAHIPAP